ncbi:MAG: response regulator [Desulfobacterales bacterium]|jgi:CheY-like chemotaxis protein
MYRDSFQLGRIKTQYSNIPQFHYSPPPADGRSKLSSKNNAGIMALPAANDAEEIYRRENRKGSILVANGDKKIRKQLSTILDRMGYDVVVSGNGEEALDLFIKKSFDIVFAALKMPGMDGLTLSLQVKATSLNTPVGLILDENIKNITNRTRAGRIDFIIFKPFKFKEIQKTVRYFLRTGRYDNRAFL